MELHAFDGERPVAQAHDLAVLGPGGDLEAVRQRVALDGERVVTRAGEWIRQAGKDAAIAVCYLRDLAVHQALGVHDAPAKSFADRLMAEADAEQRNLARERADRRRRNPGLRRRSRPGRDDEIVGRKLGDLGKRNRVVAKHLHVLTEFAEILHEVVSEGIVVVDHQQHF